MPTYEYKSIPPCPHYTDGRHCLLTSPLRETTLWCEFEECHDTQTWTQMKRVYTSVQFGRVMHEHMNVAVGKPISDMRQFKDELARSSDRESERMGFTVNYQPADLTDDKALKVNEDGMDATHDEKVRTGERESKGRFVWPMK